MPAGVVIAAARGSAHEQAKAKVGRVEIDDVTVAFGPRMVSCNCPLDMSPPP
jgi:hypothetical protein